MSESSHVSARVRIVPRFRDGLSVRVPKSLWGLGRGTLEMVALASLVPVASDTVVTAIFAGYSMLTGYRIFRHRKATAPKEEPASESAARALRLFDQVDASSDFLDDLGRAAPLSVPLLWFGLSIPPYLAAGQFFEVGTLVSAAVLTSVPFLEALRSGVRKAVRCWRGRRELRDLGTSSSGVVS